MLMSPNGIDVFYVDESHDQTFYVVTAVAVPFVRKVDNVWSITWPDHLSAAKEWRRAIAEKFHVPRKKELHGNLLASGRGNYHKGKYNFSKSKARGVYGQILQHLDMAIPGASIISAASKRGSAALYGHTRLQAALYALLQRMRSQCRARGTNGMVFFDQGHPEYRSLYRQAQVYLPTGSRLGGWEGGTPSKNMPLNMFVKDGNEKNSRFCYFTQIADLVAYAAFLKIKSESDALEAWQKQYNFDKLYDEIPRSLVNLEVTKVGVRDGIVRRL